MLDDFESGEKPPCIGKPGEDDRNLPSGNHRDPEWPRAVRGQEGACRPSLSTLEFVMQVAEKSGIGNRWLRRERRPRPRSMDCRNCRSAVGTPFSSK